MMRGGAVVGIGGYDWSALGGSDPVPGDPGAVAAMAAQLSDLADSAALQSRLVQGVGSGSEAMWVGPAADVFRRHVGRLPGELGKLVVSYRDASEALSSYAPKLRCAQELALRALVKARAADAAIRVAQAGVRAASQAVQAAQAAYDAAAAAAWAAAAAGDPSAGAGLAAAAEAVAAAEGQLQAAQQQLSAAEADRQAAFHMRDTAAADAGRAASVCAGRLDAASRAGIQNPNHSWFASVVGDVGHAFGDVGHAVGDVGGWVDHNWEKLSAGLLLVDAGKWLSQHWVGVLKGASSVLGAISSVTGMLALIPFVGEVVMPLALASAVLVTVDDGVLALTGKGSSGWGVLIDAVGVAGFGAGEGLSFLGEGMADAADTASKLEQAQSKVSSAEEEVVSLRGQLSALQDERQAVEAAAGRTEPVVAAHPTEGVRPVAAGEVQSRLADVQSRLDDASARLDEANAHVGEHEAKLANLPGHGVGKLRYALRAFDPSATDSTAARLRLLFDNRQEFVTNALQVGRKVGSGGLADAIRNVPDRAAEELAGGGRAAYRLAFGVGGGSAAAGGVADMQSWRDWIGGRG